MKCQHLKDMPHREIKQCEREALFEYEYAPNGTAYPQRKKGYYCHFHIYEAYVRDSAVSDIRIASKEEATP